MGSACSRTEPCCAGVRLVSYVTRSQLQILSNQMSKFHKMTLTSNQHILDDQAYKCCISKIVLYFIRNVLHTKVVGLNVVNILRGIIQGVS
jgi:hypothetical protein